MQYKIEKIARKEYGDVVELWEASVRATHDFLTEEDIAYFRPLILNTYLDAVDLRCIRVDDRIVGFLGVADRNLEMLFIHPKYRGQGCGKSLLEHAVKIMDVQKVDVNEQNNQAVGFYECFGFKTISRSERDGSGKPYPILHMELQR